ncbi:hypothetical protein F6Q07_15285 [Pectobacterium parmentieri]|uniref:Uncharacterized protein n=1 Tax=Pectobacterium parmentieri TaxID=1905730 RepID=A0A0H3I4B1_PECPM|nr:conserved hypothetical protein [Pectobacterium parmentieri WPP163]AFI90159.1 Hypothetical protein W5S_2070 [Pectobacterium parmentieri]AOR58897.1 hypothetical protein A8F97_08250 [Pectobacterium parmentieri]AYH01354.1 hypothetical protein C5E26_10640 [Pectobacterium parmentieri]AYH05619.1 hypothetical protein C5E25_09810 [Pectobacterium parmentieri]
MTNWGLGSLVAGIVWLIVSFNMSTSIVIDGKLVTNVFLIAARESQMNMGWLLVVVGGVFTFLGVARKRYTNKHRKP